MRSTAGLVAFFVLTGCATGMGPKSEEPPAKVHVYREPSPRDSLFQMVVGVDGRPVTGLSPGEERSLEIPAGDHKLEYELGVYKCAADLRVESGKTYVYRLAQGCIIERLNE